MAKPPISRIALAIRRIRGESFLSRSPDTKPLMQKKHMVMVKLRLRRESVKYSLMQRQSKPQRI
jgi:hypothetical protein